MNYQNENKKNAILHEYRDVFVYALIYFKSSK